MGGSSFVIGNGTERNLLGLVFFWPSWLLNGTWKADGQGVSVCALLREGARGWCCFGFSDTLV